MRELDPLQLRDHLAGADEAPLLLDVREPWEFEICRLADSVNVPMGQVANTPLDREREIVVICHHGVRSYHVAAWLENQGFQRVINLSGGIHAWAERVALEMARY